MQSTSTWKALINVEGDFETITVFRFRGASDDQTIYAFLSRDCRAQAFDYDNLIEYVYPDAFVERDGELFWRQFINGRVTFTKVTSRFIEE